MTERLEKHSAIREEPDADVITRKIQECLRTNGYPEATVSIDSYTRYLWKVKLDPNHGNVISVTFAEGRFSVVCDNRKQRIDKKVLHNIHLDLKNAYGQQDQASLRRIVTSNSQKKKQSGW